MAALIILLYMFSRERDYFNQGGWPARSRDLYFSGSRDPIGATSGSVGQCSTQFGYRCPEDDHREDSFARKSIIDAGCVETVGGEYPKLVSPRLPILSRKG